MNVDRGTKDHGRQLMNLHNNEAGRRVSNIIDSACNKNSQRFSIFVFNIKNLKIIVIHIIVACSLSFML